MIARFRGGKPGGYAFTPIVWLVLLLCLFELAIRVPYLIWAKSNVAIGYSSRFQNFSIYNPDSVILSGSLIVVMILIAGLAAHRLAMPTLHRRAGEQRLIGVGWQALAVAGLTMLAVAYCINTLGLSTLAENVSAKRDLESMEGGVLLYIMLKVSLFSHVVATLFFMQYLGSQSRIALILAGLFGAITLVVSVIFSQRAMLFVLGFELIYVTYLYGQLNVRRLVSYALPFAVVLVGIGVVRSAAADGLGLGEAALLGLDKLMVSRYFFNIAKMGCVYEWQYYSGLIDFLSFNFLIEPFNPGEVVFFKDVGRLVGLEVFGAQSSGVTLGFVSEYILSFGAVIGTFFTFVTFFALFQVERAMLAARRLPLIAFFALAKTPILLNTSLGSYAYQLVIETALLLPIVFGVKWSDGPVAAATKGLRAFPARMGRRALRS